MGLYTNVYKLMSACMFILSIVTSISLVIYLLANNSVNYQKAVVMYNENKWNDTTDSNKIFQEVDDKKMNYEQTRAKWNLKQSAYIGDESKFDSYVICPCDNGRLGNHMFQLAVTFGVSNALKYIPAIRASHPMLKLFEMENVKRLRSTKLNNLVRIEKFWFRDDTEKYKAHNITISGMLHSWKHFLNATEAVRKALTIKSIYLNSAKSFLRNHIQGIKTIIGIHVRRGDYLAPKEQKLGRVVADRNFTRKAMAFYRQQYQDTQFVVLSDDMKWCKNNIKGSDVIYSEFKEPILDMAIMSLCHHMIITVGTFSWWGGWLSGGTVVYLNDFPRPGSEISKILGNDYYPPHWIGMSNKMSY